MYESGRLRLVAMAGCSSASIGGKHSVKTKQNRNAPHIFVMFGLRIKRSIGCHKPSQNSFRDFE